MEVGSQPTTSRAAAMEAVAKERFDDLSETRFNLLGRQRPHVLKASFLPALVGQLWIPLSWMVAIQGDRPASIDLNLAACYFECCVLHDSNTFDKLDTCCAIRRPDCFPCRL